MSEREECECALLDALTDYLEGGGVDLDGGLSLKRQELANRGCDADTLMQHNLLRKTGPNSYAVPKPIIRLAIEAEASRSESDIFVSNSRAHLFTQTMPRASISPGLQAQQRKGRKRSRAAEKVTSAGPLEGATSAPGVTNTQQDLAQPDGAYSLSQDAKAPPTTPTTIQLSVREDSAARDVGPVTMPPFSPSKEVGAGDSVPSPQPPDTVTASPEPVDTTPPESPKPTSPLEVPTVPPSPLTLEVAACPSVPVVAEGTPEPFVPAENAILDFAQEPASGPPQLLTQTAPPLDAPVAASPAEHSSVLTEDAALVFALEHDEAPRELTTFDEDRPKDGHAAVPFKETAILSPFFVVSLAEMASADVEDASELKLVAQSIAERTAVNDDTSTEADPDAHFERMVVSLPPAYLAPTLPLRPFATPPESMLMLTMRPPAAP